MANNEVVSLTKEELIELLIDPDNIYASVKGIKDHPLDIRYKNNRICRYMDGSVVIYVGWYDPVKSAILEAKYKKWLEDLRSKLGIFNLLKKLK